MVFRTTATALLIFISCSSHQKPDNLPIQEGVTSIGTRIDAFEGCLDSLLIGLADSLALYTQRRSPDASLLERHAWIEQRKDSVQHAWDHMYADIQEFYRLMGVRSASDFDSASWQRIRDRLRHAGMRIRPFQFRAGDTGNDGNGTPR